MESIVKWICENKEWLFSGVAVAALGFIIKMIKKGEVSNSGQQSQNQSQTQTNTQTVNVNIPQPLTGNGAVKEEAKVLAKALKIDGMRAQTNILFIDDDKEFKTIVPILKKAGWKNTSFFSDADVKDTSAEKIQKAHIIFVDIKGVGKTMYEDEGLGLVADLKRKYPDKKVVIYSAIPEHKVFHEAMKLADDRIPKNSQPAVFVSAIETLAEDIWKS